MSYYDLNVYDKVGHETGYQQEGWAILVYGCDQNFYHEDVPEKIIYLNETQRAMLTLGVSEECGGDYCADDDFWIDPQSFLNTFQNIPRKVRRILEEVV